MKEITAALIALAEANVPTDLQELLTRGNPGQGIAPGALEKAIAAVDRQRAVERRIACRHPNRRGSAMIGSDGASRSDWFCPDCGASDHSETPASKTGQPPILLQN